MGYGENTPGWWERMKLYWRSRSQSTVPLWERSASWSDKGASITDLASHLDRQADRHDNAGDNTRAEALFQAADRERESGATARCESIAHRADPLNFGGSLFGFSAGDAGSQDPQAFADPGPFVDPRAFPDPGQASLDNN